MLTVHVDSRESKLCNNFEKLSFSIHKVQLQLGDIVIQNDDRTEFVIERKTIDDLSASIKDGRYHEQKKRLFDNFERKKIIYIIEDFQSFTGFSTIEKSAFIHTMFRDNVNLIFTKDPMDTCIFIQALFDRIVKNPQYFFSGGEETSKNYFTLNTIKKKKPEIVDIHRGMLCQIPGISVNTANALLEKFGNFKEVLKADRDQLQSTKSNGRRISSKVIDTLLSI